MCLCAQKVYGETQNEKLWYRQIAAEFGRVAVPNITKLFIIIFLIFYLIIRKCLPQCIKKESVDTLKASLLKAKSLKEEGNQNQFEFEQNMSELQTSLSESEELAKLLKIPLLNKQVSIQFKKEQEEEIQKIKKNQFIKKMTFLARRQKMSVFE